MAIKVGAHAEIPNILASLPASTFGFSAARVILFAGFALLGMPLSGVIPVPTDLGVEGEQPPDIIAVAVIWSVIYFLSGCLLLTRHAELLAIVQKQWSLVALLAWLGCSTAWSHDMLTGFLSLVQIVGSVVFGFMVGVWFKTRVTDYVRIVGWALSALVLVNFVAVVCVPESTIDLQGRWAGVTGNANYLGSAAAVAVIYLAATYWIAGRPWQRFAIAGVGILAAILLWNTGSVTSSASAIAGASVLAFYGCVSRTRVEYCPPSPAKVLAVLTAGMIIIAAGGFHGFVSLAGKDATLTGRTHIWQVGIDRFLSSPLLGFGLSADTASTGVLPVATNFHNGILEVAVKAGVPGVLLTGWWGFTIFGYLRRVPAHPGWAREALLASTFLAMVIHNLAESSLFMARSPIWIMFLTSAALVLAAWTGRECELNRANELRKW